MNLKETVETLLTLYGTNHKVLSTGYGTREAYSTSKKGVLYPRAYLYLVEAQGHYVTLELTVTSDVLPDLSNRLQVQSDTLTIIKELTQMMIASSLLKTDISSVRYDPTRLHKGDQSEGYTFEFDVPLIEDIDVCLEVINPIIE